MGAGNNGAQSPLPNAGNTTTPTTNANIQPPHHHHHHNHHHNNNSNNNNNNNSSSRGAGGSNTENSGSQYAMCALGVGLVALGIVMIVWSVVPADGGGKNDSSTSEGGGGGEGGGRRDNRNKVSSVAFVLVGSGVVMLLLSLCLGIRNKQREQRGLRDAELRREAGVASGPREGAETAEEHAQRFAVPSYEEVVGSGQYPIRQSNLRQSSTHLPSYEDLVEQADSVQFENEGMEGVVVAAGDPASAAATIPTEALAPNRRAGKAARKLLPNKIRRIKSEKLHLKNVDNSQGPAGLSIEPLTPPPQYEEKGPPI